MRRGDLVPIVVSGDYGKPRPALVVQADEYASFASVVVLPLTSDIVPDSAVRVTVEPDPPTGLRARSQIMVDKVSSIPRAKVGKGIGRVTEATQAMVDARLAAFLGLKTAG